ncbi:MAG: DNA-directed RNA polymerase subunit alpha [Chloroflexi bacterium]|nr:DNA-directed RNA polymerase subunit alpha [Chloroflexota bacterium]
MFETEEPKIETEESRENYGRFVAEPLEPGFGVTLGNALRRVLLSSIPGVAVTWVKIDGVDHDFSAIPYLKEDTVEFLLNVKEIRLRALTDRPGKMTLDVSGEGQIVAGDIVPSADFEIINPELYLATMSADEGRLTVEFNVEHGKGYVPATYGNGLPIGVLPVDAIFTPVRKVNYSIKPTRVGQVTNYDSLTLEVWTDGTLTPLDAVRKAAETLLRQFELFRGLGRTASPTPGKPTLADSLTQEQYDIPVEQLNLSVRTFNCLRRANVTKVGEILEMNEEDLLKIKNFGQKSLQELHERLQSMGLLPAGATLSGEVAEVGTGDETADENVEGPAEAEGATEPDDDAEGMGQPEEPPQEKE